MKINLFKDGDSYTNALKILVITLLVLGIFFRFINLDKKVYWRDEALTSLQISGYTQVELAEKVADGRILGLEELKKYQNPDPSQSLLEGVPGAIRPLAIETPEHPPFYYALARIWVQLFGGSVGAIRGLSALLSLLVFPSAYWLCRELFEKPVVPWVTIALIAISPLHVLYAQEAREYSLWTATILLCSAALLRALKTHRRGDWLLYVATLTLALYTYLFSAFVAVSHGLYVLATERFRMTRHFLTYVGSSLLALLLFSPWIYTVIVRLPELKKSMAWINYKFTFLELSTRWVFNLSRLFIDWNYGFSFNNPIPYLIIFSVLGFAIYSTYVLCRQTPFQVWFFVLTLMLVPAFILVAPDLISGGQRSRVIRYLIPTYLAVQLAVSHLLSMEIMALTTSQWRRKIWQGVTLMVLTGGVLSCVVSSRAETWWSKTEATGLTATARIINQTRNPLVVSDVPLVTDVLALTHELDPKVQFQIVTQPNVPEIPASFSDIFLFGPSKSLRTKLETEKSYKLTKIKLDVQGKQLWKLEK